jgi:hypothetical protein
VSSHEIRLSAEVQLSRKASLRSIVERAAYQRTRYYLMRSEKLTEMFEYACSSLSSVSWVRTEAERLGIDRRRGAEFTERRC